MSSIFNQGHKQEITIEGFPNELSVYSEIYENETRTNQTFRQQFKGPDIDDHCQYPEMVQFCFRIKGMLAILFLK